jgi:hypothetical protein
MAALSMEGLGVEKEMEYGRRRAAARSPALQATPPEMITFVRSRSSAKMRTRVRSPSMTVAWKEAIRSRVGWGQLLTMNLYAGELNFQPMCLAETREYNGRMQMTRPRAAQGATVAMDLWYVFTKSGVRCMMDGLLSGMMPRSGRRCRRCRSRWDQPQTKGAAPGSAVSYDQGTNRANSEGYSADANENMTAMPGATALPLALVSDEGMTSPGGFLPELASVYLKASDIEIGRVLEMAKQRMW